MKKGLADFMVATARYFHLSGGEFGFPADKGKERQMANTGLKKDDVACRTCSGCPRMLKSG